jgi:hypothetical protein
VVAYDLGAGTDTLHLTASLQLVLSLPFGFR